MPKTILSLLIHLFCIVCLPSYAGRNTTDSILTSESDYYRILQVRVDAWFNNYSLSYTDIFQKLDSAEIVTKDSYGNNSLIYSYILHKKGIICAELGLDKKELLWKAIEYFKQAYTIRKNNKSTNDSVIIPEIINSCYNIGYTYYDLKKPYLAIDWFKKGMEIPDKQIDNPRIIKLILRIYFMAAWAYCELGDFDNMLKYHSAIIHYENQKMDTILQEFVSNLKIKALIVTGGVQAIELNSPAKAVVNLTTAIDLLSQNNDDSKFEHNLADAYHNLGIANRKLGDLESAKQFYRNSIIINSNYERSQKLFQNYLSLGILYIEQNQNDSAEFNINTAKTYQNKESLYQRVLVNENLGDIEFNRGNFLLSLEYDNKALMNLIAGFDPEDITDNPEVEEIALLDKPSLLVLLNSKANSFLSLYHREEDITYLRNAWHTFELADYVIGLLRSEFQVDASKMTLVSKTKPIYENAIETCWHMFQITKHDSCIKKAFKYSENSRAIILLDAVRSSNAISNLPWELVEKKKKTNLRLNFYEKQAALWEQTIVDPVISEYLYDSLLFLRRIYDKIIDSIQSQYPDYHTAIYKQGSTSLKDIMAQLQKDQTFVEYFLGDSNAYAFVLNSEKYGFIKLEKPDSLVLWINNFNKNLRLKNQQFLSDGFKLYNFLLAPVYKQFSVQKRLTLVPDGVLNSIVFDILPNTNPGNERIYFPTYSNYLIFQHQIAYLFSATALFEVKNDTKSQKKQFLGVAPKFTGTSTINETTFDILEQNRKEVRQIKRLFRSSKVIGRNSSPGLFLKTASAYNLIHIASHAKANNKNGDLSYIIFNRTNEGILFAKDLYALDLNSEMVMLSACETGLGSLTKGEGTISLARGFIYSGSASVITSLWNVREKSNRKIILEFYKGLKAAESKDQALRNAKLSYLNSITIDNQHLAHPFYWAPLICVGDTEPVHSLKKASYLKITGIMVGSLIILLLVFKSLKTNKVSEKR